ncbi:MAG: right-handed parallel beta-helix repeat-containing protein [Verrucomicrobiales bacterium]
MKLLSKATSLSAACILLSAFPLMANGSGIILTVTHNGDSGAGSFRAALAGASADPSVKGIHFRKNIGTVELLSSAVYTGTQSLTIEGADAVIEPDVSAGNFDLLVSRGGGDLSLRDVTIQNSGGAGVFVDVPEDATGVLRVELSNVTLADNALEGLLISDCEDDVDGCAPDDDLQGSEAGIELAVKFSVITGNGFAEGVSDIDGIRVNERSEGGVFATIDQSSIDGNGGDGIEIDESGDGTIDLDARNSTFDDNGNQDPNDVEDGIDLDERDSGDIVASFNNVSVARCFDEGIDINEHDDGDLKASLRHVDATNAGGGDGIRCREDGSGDVVFDAEHILAAENDDEGIQLSEEGEGHVAIWMKHVDVLNNSDHGIQIEEADAGHLGAQLDHLLVDNNNDDGIQMEESGDGDFVASVEHATIRDSKNYGIKASQDDAGEGELGVKAVLFSGNGDGDIKVTDVEVK